MAINHQSACVKAFHCLGDQCEDTCCKGWGMQLSAQTVALYREKAPELLDAVTSGEAEHIMKRDAETDYCVKFESGWCGIHREYGESFLGDACHFFPRVTRKLGEMHLMTAGLSCPEIVRLGVTGEAGFAMEAGEIERVPFSLRDYLPEGVTADKALAAHQACIAFAGDASRSAARSLSCLRSVAASLDAVEMASWGMAVPFYVQHAESRLPIAESQATDPFNLLNALQGLVGAARQTPRPRLAATIDAMQAALNVTLNWETLGIQLAEDSLPRYQAMQQRWDREWATHFEPVLRRWLQAQLSIALFPFAGFGQTNSDRMTIIGVRFATLKLALMSACQLEDACIDEGRTVIIIQSLARFMDHLADPSLSMQIYHEPGWNRESRLRALTGDF